MSDERLSLNPDRVRGIELFPDLSEEMDRRVQYAEQRLKSWILAGIAANLFIAITAAIPLIFYMGQVSRDISMAIQQSTMIEAELKQRRIWTQERMVWEARVEAELATRGISISKERVPGQGL